jgi:hypothetical protein
MLIEQLRYNLLFRWFVGVKGGVKVARLGGGKGNHMFPVVAVVFVFWGRLK